MRDFVTTVLPMLSAEAWGDQGWVLLFSLVRSVFRGPLPRLPDPIENTPDRPELVYLFDIRTVSNVAEPGPEFVDRMVERNRVLWQRARALGGRVYPVGTVPFDNGDWREHFGDYATEYRRLKEIHDPNSILTPGGPGVF